jgi:tRNA threonylcarbamoyladenosine biosynthesis protein TsaE
MSKIFISTSEADMAWLAKNLVKAGIATLELVTLDGMLGAGKTTLVKNILLVLGYKGLVKSPTFTLVEPYQFGEHSILHLDLYRMEDPREIEALGYRDWFNGNNLILLEWPEKAAGFLPDYDLNVMINTQDNKRQLVFKAGTEAGRQVLEKLELE